MIAKLDHHDLLVLDDLSYVQHNHADTSTLFKVIAPRYERRSLPVTSNHPFATWDRILPDKIMMVAKAVTDRVSGRRPEANPDIVAAALGNVEAELGLALEPEQRAAVAMAVGSGFCVVDGGAGTGKSTITRAVARVAENLGRPYIQTALSGRAARRLRDATGQDAMTIHRFIKGG